MQRDAKKKSTINYDRYGYIFIAPFFIVFIIFQLYPIFFTFKTSLTDAVGWDKILNNSVIGFKNFQEFCLSLKNDGNEVSGFFGTSCISVKDLRAGERIRLGWAPDRLVEMRYLGNFEFVVEESRNSKLLAGDRFELSDIISGCPLCINRILRNGKYTRPYIAAMKEGLNLLEKC